MAPQSDLYKIGLEGFDLVEGMFGRKGRPLLPSHRPPPAPQGPTPPPPPQRDCQYRPPQPYVAYHNGGFEQMERYNLAPTRPQGTSCYQYHPQEPYHVLVHQQSPVSATTERVSYYQYYKPQEPYAYVEYEAPASEPKETGVMDYEAAQNLGGILISEYRKKKPMAY
ncbi:unnamed protein product [Ilex paraguariensis]|uniref:Uncharacterized protein n=1 Tax=Ilex paraguariensis TaxID=185542 RepID=A0ABC8RPW7_9AQUA